VSQGLTSPHVMRTSRSQWARGLRRGSAAVRLVGLRVRMRAGAWLSPVNVLCRQVEVSATGRSLVRGVLLNCVCVSLSVIMCNSNPLHLPRVGGGGWNKKERKEGERNGGSDFRLFKL
jgi:hypothetical protein